mgnify:CR=1 FL=1
MPRALTDIIVVGGSHAGLFSAIALQNAGFCVRVFERAPEILRGTGAGFCYNAGRVVAAIGPFVVGSVASRGADSLASALRVLFWVGAVPLAGLLLLPFVVETRGRVLAD